MDIKILLLGLLFIIADVFPAYANPVGDAEEIVKNEPSSDKFQTEVQENKIEIGKAYAKAQNIKSKELMNTANIYAQVANDRKNYYQEYKKLAEDIKEKARNNEQKAAMEAASLDGIENRRKEWEVKSREAETNGKTHQMQSQRLYAEAMALSRKIEAAVVAAAAAEAEARGLEYIADKERQWASELKNKGEELLNEAARNHLTKAKEAEQRATANKIKAQQQDEEAQRHFQAARSLEEQVLKAEVASLDNLARYIALSVQADEAAIVAKEEELSAVMEEMISGEQKKRAQRVEVIIKILEKEAAFLANKVKKQEGEANMYSQSAQAVGSDFVSHSASMLKLASTKEDGEIEHDDEQFSDQKLKNMPFVSQKMID